MRASAVNSALVSFGASALWFSPPVPPLAFGKSADCDFAAHLCHPSTPAHYIAMYSLAIKEDTKWLWESSVQQQHLFFRWPPQGEEPQAVERKTWRSEIGQKMSYSVLWKKKRNFKKKKKNVQVLQRHPPFRVFSAHHASRWILLSPTASFRVHKHIQTSRLTGK